jgi:GntR family transcriptional regulator
MDPLEEPQVCLDGGQPIDRQIYEQIRDCIRTGQLQAGEQLPSSRGLAVELAVNPGSVERAYDWLEQQGLTSSAEGCGVRVVGPVADEDDPQARHVQLEQLCMEFLSRTVRLGYTLEDVWTMTAAIYHRRYQSCQHE